MIIALDVEGTLVSNAVSQIPRPGLASFLDECAALASRVVVITAVRESDDRPYWIRVPTFDHPYEEPDDRVLADVLRELRRRAEEGGASPATNPS